MPKIYNQLHNIIDLPRKKLDDVIPDGQAHIVYIMNPIQSNILAQTNAREFIPIVVPGFQWDHLWWIYRLMSDIDQLDTIKNPFPKFLNDYMEELYVEYLRKR